MISRFKNVILHAAGVDNFNPNSLSTTQASSGGSNSSGNGSSSNNQTSTGKRNSEIPARKHSKYEYGRPAFLKLVTQDEILVSADHIIRPILVPRDIASLPWSSGYAE